VLPLITDGLPRIEEAIRWVYPLAQWQRWGMYMAGSRKEALEALEKLRAA